MPVIDLETKLKRGVRPIEGDEAHCEHAWLNLDEPECPAGESWRVLMWPCIDHPDGCEGHGFCHAHMAALLLDRVHRGLIAAIHRVDRGE